MSEEDPIAQRIREKTVKQKREDDAAAAKENQERNQRTEVETNTFESRKMLNIVIERMNRHLENNGRHMSYRQSSLSVVGPDAPRDAVARFEVVLNNNGHEWPLKFSVLKLGHLDCSDKLVSRDGLWRNPNISQMDEAAWEKVLLDFVEPFL